jgi:hypothetical protein
MQEAMLKRVRTVFDEITTIEPWLGGEMLKSAAVFYSEKSRIWYGRDQRENRYDNHLFGTCRALLEEQIMFDIITHLSADRLGGYDVLLLPNTACLDDDEVSVIEEFVRAGGGLVSTGCTSLWDGEGDARDDFALADVMGLTGRGDTSEYTRVFARYDAGQTIARDLPEDGFIACWGPVQKTDLTSGTALSTVYYPIAEPTGDRFVNIMANPPAESTRWPASVLNQFGAGKVVTFLHHIDRDYLRLSFPELRYLLRNAVSEVRGKHAPVEVVDGPLCVEINAYHRAEQRQWIVHLVNFQPETGKNNVSWSKTPDYASQGLPGAASRQQVQKILPVIDLTVRLDLPRDEVESVVLQPAGEELGVVPGDGCLFVTVSRLHVHAILVVQLTGLSDR